MGVFPDTNPPEPMTRHPLSRLVLLAALLLGLAAGADAQDRQRPTPAEHTARLIDALDLTPAQAELIETALRGAPGSGNLWTLAAELTPTLSDAQKEALFAGPERGEARRVERRQRAERGARGEHGERRRMRAERSDREAHFASTNAMRNAALGLSARQIEQLEALHAERRTEMEQRRAAVAQGERQERSEAARAERREARIAQREEHRAALAEILSPEQLEIVKVHGALQMRLHPRHSARRGAHR